MSEMQAYSPKDKKIRICILSFTLALTVLFVSLGGWYLSWGW